MENENRIALLPKSINEQNTIRDDYGWLTKALSRHCDQVIDKFYENGHFYAVGVVWQKGSNRARFAFPVESRDFSVNTEIRENRLTRREVVKSFTEHRPSWA